MSIINTIISKFRKDKNIKEINNKKTKDKICKERNIVNIFHNSEYDFFRFVHKIEWSEFNPEEQYSIHATDPYWLYENGDLIAMEMKKSYYVFELSNIERNSTTDTELAGIVGTVKFLYQVMKPETIQIHKKKPGDFAILR